MIIDKLYKPHLNSYHSISTVHLRNLNIKNLKRLDSRLAKNYADYKRMGGGSLKSFLGKVGRFGRKVLNAMPAISRKLHALTGKALTWLNTDTGKAIVDKLAKAAETGLKLPGISNIIKKIPEVAKEGFDRLTEIVQGIKEKNPGVSVEQATQLVKDIYNTSKNIYNEYQDSKKKAEEETAKIADKLSDVIKEEGKQEISAGLMKAGKYLPLFSLVNPVYVKKSKDGGMIKLPVPKFKKPSDLIKKYISEQAVKDYPTAAVNKYAGRLYLAGMCGPTPENEPRAMATVKGSKSGRLYLGGEDEIQNVDNKFKKGIKQSPETEKSFSAGKSKGSSKGKSLLDKLRNGEL